MTLPATFSLTPRESFYLSSSNEWALLYVHGSYSSPKFYATYPYCFDMQHAEDYTCFTGENAADPALDYTDWANRRKVPRLQLTYNLSALDPNKQKDLLLVFSFKATSDSRLLIYTASGLLEDMELEVGDNQFPLLVPTLDFFELHFIHSCVPMNDFGGHWLFKGINGHVV